jgi:hypothetical protein
MATFTAWDTCQDSCWFTVGDDEYVANNTVCGNEYGKSWGGLKKRCNLTGRYVSFLGYNPNYWQG